MNGPYVDLEHAVPGWVVHVALGVVSIASVVLTVGLTDVARPLLVLVLLGMVGGTVVTLRRGAEHGLAIATLFLAVPGFLASAPVGYSWHTPVVVLLLHAVVRLSWLASHVHPGSVIEGAVLLQEGRRFLAFNLAGQAVGLLAGLVTAVTDGGTGATVPWLAAVGGAALVLLAVLLRRGLPQGLVSGAQTRADQESSPAA